MLFKKGGVRSHLTEEVACNKNYCSEPTVFSKISKPDCHLIKALSSQKKKKRLKEDNNNNQSQSSLLLERKTKQQITLSLVLNL